jgi:T-complex protein 1 subunit delta
LGSLQDAAAGDGTTSVVVICGALLKKSLELLEMGIHPTLLSEGFAKAAEKAVEVRGRLTVPAIALRVEMRDFFFC